MNECPNEERGLLADEVSACLRSAGAQIVGFADPVYFKKYGGGFLPDVILPQAKAVIVAGVQTVDPVLDAWIDYAPWRHPRSFLDELLAGHIKTVCLMLERKGYKSEPVTYQPGLLLKNAAAIAGVGFIGRNNLFISTAHGAGVRLRAAVTEAPLICGEPNPFRQACEECVKCIEACPAKAVSEAEYSMGRCLDYQRGHLTAPFKGASVWCTICSDVCPAGRQGFSVNPK